MIPNGDRAGEPFEPLRWHHDVFRFMLDPDEPEAVYSLPRGNVKSGVMLAVCLAAITNQIPTFGNGAVETLWTANDLKTCEATFRQLELMMSQASFAPRMKVTRSKMIIYDRLTGGTFEAVVTGRAAQGRAPRLHVLDEVAHWKAAHHAREALAAARSGVSKVRGKVIATSTRISADEYSGVVLEELLADLRNGEIAGSLYTAPEGCAIDDVEAIRAANPGVGESIDLKTLQRLARRTKGREAVARFRCFTLNQAVSVANPEGWINPDLVDAMRGEAAPDGPARAAVAVGAVDEPTVASVFWPDSGRLESIIFAARPCREEAQRAGLPVDNLNAEGQWLEFPAADVITEAAAWCRSKGASAITTQSWRAPDVEAVASLPVSGISRDDLCRAVDVADRLLRDRGVTLPGVGSIPAIALTACRLSPSGFDGRRVVRGDVIGPNPAVSLAMAIGHSPPEKRPYHPMSVSFIDLGG